MATITTDTFLDDGTARTAGESWAMTGCKLTIRTDTRWHVGAPAAMTGSIGNVAINSFAELFVDGTKVRWQPFNNGTGLVPAIGETVTQFGNPGVEGYILGVWEDLASSPSTPGTSMPSTGFLKYREVTGGSFLPVYGLNFSGGLGACIANGDEVVGWIEVVADASSSLSFSQPSCLFKVRGDWFYLGETTGSPGQIVQLPTNGSSLTRGLGVQIETSPGSGVYEWWPAVPSTNGWTTNGLTTDQRGKFVESLTNGQVRIGSDGSNNIGYTPASGCKIRTPNVFIQHCTTSNRSQNVINTTITQRGWRVSANSALDIDRLVTTQQFTPNAATLLSVSDCLIDGYFQSTNGVTAPALTDVAITSSVATNYGPALLFTDHIGGTITRAKVCFVATTALSLTRCASMTFDDCITGQLYNRTSVPGASSLSNSTYCTFNNHKIFGNYFLISTCKGITFNDLDYIERLDGPTLSSSPTSYILNITNGSEECVVDGLTFGLNGVLADTHPYAANGMINLASSAGGGNLFRNFGSFASPLPTGSNASTRPGRIIGISQSGGQKPNKFQRIYFDALRVTSQWSIGNYTAINFEISEFGALYTGAAALQPSGYNAIFKGLYGNQINFSGNSGAIGVFFADQFTDADNGRFGLFFSPPTDETAAYYDYSFSEGSGFSPGIVVLLRKAGDYATLETPHWVKGHTGFKNQAPVISGTSTNTITEYAIDTGSGYGAFQTLSAANLIAESIDSVTGFKMKIRITCTADNTVAQISCVSIYTTTSPAAHGVNLYPLDQVTLSFEGLQPGSEVRAYVGTDPATAVEIGGIESVPGTTWSFTHDSAGQDGYIAVFALGYNPLIIPRTYASEDSTLLISQVVDRNYVNP